HCLHSTPPHPYPLSLHDALPISCNVIRTERENSLRGRTWAADGGRVAAGDGAAGVEARRDAPPRARRRVEHRRGAVGGVAETPRSEEHTSELQSPYDLVCRLLLE